MVGFQIHIEKWSSVHSSVVSWEVILKTEIFIGLNFQAVSADSVADQNKQKCAEFENDNSYMANTKKIQECVQNLFSSGKATISIRI